MKPSFVENRKKWICLLTLIMMLQLLAASYFCMQKQGFHYDEYYSYYSSNVTYGLAPTDREWKDTEEIRSEFMVLPGQGFQYGMVRQMQTYDVHPPLYYFLLHTVCSLFTGMFSKWFGLALNLVFFIIAYWLFARISWEVFRGNRMLTAVSCLLFGFQPGVYSGITFIRMYMLLLVWCLAVMCWHIPFWKKEIRLTPGRGISLLLLVAAGFLTHYYFAVFLFFLAAYTCLYEWLGRKNKKRSIAYGIAVCSGMGIAVLLYPACLSHILRGYRGTEATDAFFELSNTILRLDFFTKLMNASVFGGAFWLLVIIFLCILLTRAFLERKNPEAKNRERLFLAQNQGLFCILTVTLGYFLVVAKTALLNAQEANRYELPVYGFCLLLMMAGIYYGGKGLRGRGTKYAGGLLAAFVFFCQLFSLVQGNVQFLYPEDRKNVDWAKQNREAAVVYLYNPHNVWMIWDEAEELMQYERIYFVSLADSSAITDEELLQENKIYVYTSRMDEAEGIMDGLLQDNVKLKEKEKIRQLLYCDLYCLE